MIQFKYVPETWDTPLGSLSDPSPMQEMTMTLTTEGLTWDEATREFHNFLRAAGFVIPYDIEWYEDGKDVDDDPLQKLTDWEEKYRPEECGVVKGFDRLEKKRIVDEKIGAWLSAALEDPSTGPSMKDDINEWFECTFQEKNT
jgi:hypothetical protein